MQTCAELLYANVWIVIPEKGTVHYYYDYFFHRSLANWLAVVKALGTFTQLHSGEWKWLGQLTW